jgi:hypothetical protein
MNKIFDFEINLHVIVDRFVATSLNIWLLNKHIINSTIIFITLEKFSNLINS